MMDKVFGILRVKAWIWENKKSRQSADKTNERLVPMTDGLGSTNKPTICASRIAPPVDMSSPTFPTKKGKKREPKPQVKK